MKRLTAIIVTIVLAALVGSWADGSAAAAVRPSDEVCSVGARVAKLNLAAPSRSVVFKSSVRSFVGKSQALRYKRLCTGGGGLMGVWQHGDYNPWDGSWSCHYDGLYSDGRWVHFEGWYC